MKIKFFIFILALILSLASILVLLILEVLKGSVLVLNFDSSNIDNEIKININKNKILPKICEERVWEVNLSKNYIYFFENCQLKEIIPIAYQAPEGKWYQTPTGYFRLGVKREKHISSIFPVYMNYAVQMYEDFFIHEIPYYLDGEMVSSTFSGGCLRLQKQDSINFFKKAKSGDLVVSYKDLDNIKVKNGFVFPVKSDQYYIRQRFNNPIRVLYLNGNNREPDYIQHAGIDLAPNIDARDLNVYNIYEGIIEKIVFNGKNDHGLGNTVIIKHYITSSSSLIIYSLYGHLAEINNNFKEGDSIKAGEIIGKVGATGYGCNYWRIGEDGCDKNSKLDIHLHFEIKKKSVLESPVEAECFVNGSYKKCYGYTPHNPTEYGYYEPIKFLTESK